LGVDREEDMGIRRASLVALCLVTVLIAMPAAASPAPQVTDECGDASTHAEFDGEGATLEESAGHLDIRSGGITGLYGVDSALEGVRASVSVCGAVSAEDGGYLLGWSFDGSCWGYVAWSLARSEISQGELGVTGQGQVGSSPRALVREQCFTESRSPLGNNEVETVYEVELPANAVIFEGDTVAFTVLVADLPPEAAPRFAPGAVWGGISAVAMDQGPSLWVGFFDEDGQRGEINVRTDLALGSDSYTVGEDAPQ
jgi:hypothetical protein